MVSNLLDAVKRAGLRTSRIDLTAFAVLRSLGEVDALGVNPELHGNAEALVDVGAKVTNIVVHQNGVPRFVRILPMGGDNVTDAVSERMGVPFEQAESVKQELGVSVGSAPMPVLHPAAGVIDSTAGAFLDEVRGSLAYYATQPGALQVRRVVLSGGGGLLPGLGQRLATTVQLPVQRGSALAAIRVGKTGLGPEQLEAVDSQLAVSVGLAMAEAS
jgi:type IV pilus assembly protein PilM